MDEQHRFGVQQRALLREKGTYENNYPHQLIMTATPIPRTLAMSVYADLDCSVIDELPPGRTPVSTIVISNSRRDEVLDKIHQACASGRQVYWVCTFDRRVRSIAMPSCRKYSTRINGIIIRFKSGINTWTYEVPRKRRSHVCV